MDQSKTIYANFTTNNALEIYPIFGSTPAQGMVLDLLGEIGAHYRLDTSSNLADWTNVYSRTNYVGTIHYIDSNAINLPRRFYHPAILP